MGGKIKDHQDLLNKYAEAEMGIIWERSSQISADSEELFQEIQAYAIENNLECPPRSEF